jgi:kynurenine formamidase
MTLTDLTIPMRPAEPQWDEPGQAPRNVPVLHTRTWSLAAAPTPYHARVHYFSFWSMAGTYIDFPGHIAETDDGQDAASVGAGDLFRVDAAVVRLTRAACPGPVSAADLQTACPSLPPTPGLVINALGHCRFDDIPERSVYLARDAVQWIVDRGTRLLVSDIYESNTDPQDVFRTLFRAGIAAVCYPAALGTLTACRVRLTALPLRIPGATQLPCRLLAEEEPQDAAPTGPAQGTPWTP